MEKLDVNALVSDVNKLGYNITSYQDLKKLKTKDKVLVPLLLRYLKKVNYINEKEFFVRCLGVRNFNTATETLIEEFHNNNHESYKWAIGNTLSIIQDKSHVDTYIDIMTNKKHGTARQMVAILLGKLRCQKALQTLISLLSDEEIYGHVIVALGHFKDYKLIEYIKPFVNTNEAWIRKEAKHSIKKLEQYK